MANNPENDDDLQEEIETDLDEEEEEKEEEYPEAQKEVMREWFYQHYTDPVDNTPYESAEGGYQYIWGGPYDARDELYAMFGDIVPETLIEEVVQEIEKDGE